MKLLSYLKLERLKTSLRAKVTVGVLLPLLLILGIFMVVEYSRHRAAVFANLSLLAAQWGQVLEDNLRHQMLESDEEGVTDILDIVANREEFKTVYILDISGEVIFAPNESDVGLKFNNSDPTCQNCHRLLPEDRPNSMIIRDQSGERIFRNMHPIENSEECAECHETDERLLGVLLMDISTTPIEAPLIADLREDILWWLSTILVTVLVVNLALSRFVLQRVEDLAVAINRFGQGKQSPSPFPTTEPDEIGQLTAAFNNMAQKIETRQKENTTLSEQVHQQSKQRGMILKRLLTAQEDERKRVARELHDELGQALGGLSFQTQALAHFMDKDDEQAQHQLSEIQGMIADTTDNMYKLILALRPSALDDLGLGPALQAHADRMLQGENIQFKLDTDQLTRRLPPEVETTLFRTAQEALTNIVRHAQATEVNIALACQNGTFTGTIVDNGRGFDPEQLHHNGSRYSGWGLLGMQERIALCGGELQIISHPEEGTRLQIDIPLGDHIHE